MRIGVLNNLRAGRGGPALSGVLELLRSRPDVVHVESDSAEAVPEALAALEQHGIDVLVVNGGDGTLQFALDQLLGDPRRERLPRVAPLCGGRTNMTAADLGASRHPVEGLRRVIEARDAGRLGDLEVARPVLRVSSSRRPRAQHGMFFGAGLVYRGIRLVHRALPPGRSRGTLGAGLVTGALVAKMLLRQTGGIVAPDKCQLRADGRELCDAELYLLIASSLERLFLRLDPFWGEGSGGVRITAVESGAERMARAAPGILAGRAPAWLSPERGYTSVRAETARLRMSCGYTIDGELFDPEPEEEIEIAASRRIGFLRA